MQDLDERYKQRLKAEELLTNEISKLFTSLERDVLKRFYLLYDDPSTSGWLLQEILEPIIDLEEKYVQTLFTARLAAFAAGRRDTIHLLGEKQVSKKYVEGAILGDLSDIFAQLFDLSYDLFKIDERVYNDLYNETFTSSNHVLNRVKNDVMENLSQSYRDGIGIKEAGQRLQKQFTDLKGFEANRIARTEINAAQNRGNFQTLIDYDINYHQWWTGQDARVRDSHKEIHGQITKVGNKFSNGLMHPGDRTGSIKEWINCRCTDVPYLMPLGFMAPPGMVTFKESDIIPIPGFEVPETLFGKPPKNLIKPVSASKPKTTKLKQTKPTPKTKLDPELNKLQKKTVLDYQRDKFYNLNSHLRHRTMKTMRKQEKLMVKRLDSAMTPLKEATTVQRQIGQSVGSESKFGEKLLKAGEGGTITDKGYVSTTLGKQTKLTSKGDRPLNYGDKRYKPTNWMAEINIPKGSKSIDVNKALGDMSAFPGEKELLLHRGCKFRIEEILPESKWVKLTLIN